MSGTTITLPDDVVQAIRNAPIFIDSGEEAPSMDAKGKTEHLDGVDTATLSEETQDDEPTGELFRTFTDQAIALIGTPTSDGRMLAANIELSFRSFPLPLMWCKQNTSGHDMSYTVGVIEDAHIDGDRVLASGYLLNTAEADEAAEQNAHGVSNPSVDLAGADYVYTDRDGNELDWDELWDLMDEGGEYYSTFTKAELIGTTLVATPAFDTRIKLDADRASRDVAIVASVAESFRPPSYAKTMFDNPHLTRPTLPTMDADGRIFGHIAEWGTPHRSVQHRAGQCAPRSPSKYANFHTSVANLDDGQTLPVGRLTVGIGHADTRLTAHDAGGHYDNVDACFALVRVGEDSHGIWFSGVAAPWASADTIAKGLSSPLSGDWRDFGRGLDLVAALAVNTPGFPVRGHLDSEGRERALVASGRLMPERGVKAGPALTADHIAEAVARGVTTALTESQQAREAAERRKAAAAVLNRAAKVTPTVLNREVEITPSIRDRVGVLLSKAN